VIYSGKYNRGMALDLNNGAPSGIFVVTISNGQNQFSKKVLIR